jgi:hypothetical protein
MSGSAETAGFYEALDESKWHALSSLMTNFSKMRRFHSMYGRRSSACGSSASHSAHANLSAATRQTVPAVSVSIWILYVSNVILAMNVRFYE